MKKKKWAHMIDHIFRERAEETCKKITDEEIDVIYTIAYDAMENCMPR